jgi:serine/threonine protein kinase
MLINDKFMLFSKIGSGAFGSVYKGLDIVEQMHIAAKLEDIDTKKKRLEKEADIYTYIHGNIITNCVPHMLWYGSHEEHNILILNRLGYSLDKIMKLANCQISLKTLLLLTIRCFKILKTLHNLDVIHRDIKPENFAIGHQKHKEHVYIFDFGLSKLLKNETINKKKKNSLIGTMRYASINAHEGIELSYRDDLESLMYMLIYLYNGELPWQRMDGETKDERSKNIMNCKKTINLSQLCEKLPIEYQKILIYTKTLQYFQRPEYDKMIIIFENILKKHGHNVQDKYEWLEWNDEKLTIEKNSPKNKKNNNLKKTMKAMKMQPIRNKQTTQLQIKSSVLLQPNNKVSKYEEKNIKI